MVQSRRPQTRAQARSTGRQNSGVRPARRRTARRPSGPKRSEHCCPKRGCKVTFTRRSDLGRHLKTVHNKRAKLFKCPFKSEGCGFSTKQKCNISPHVDSVHNEKKLFKCNITRCGRAYKSLSSLIRHEKKYHGLPGRRERSQTQEEKQSDKNEDDTTSLAVEASRSSDAASVGETSSRSVDEGKAREDLSHFEDMRDLNATLHDPEDSFDISERSCGLYLPSELAMMQTETSILMSSTDEPFVDRGTDGNSAMHFPLTMLINDTIWLYDARGQPYRPLPPADRQFFTNSFNANIGLSLGLEDAGPSQIALAPPAPGLENIPDYGAPLDFYTPFPDIPLPILCIIDIPHGIS